MAVNKVVYGGETLIDLTSDTVTPETLAEGVTAHDAAGNLIIGTMSTAALEARVLELESRFDILASERAVYTDIDDSNGNDINGSDDTAVEGRTVFSSLNCFTATIGTNWTVSDNSYVQYINVNGILATDRPFVDILLSDEYYMAEEELRVYDGIYRITTVDGGIIVHASYPTKTSFNIQMEVHR